MSAPVLAPPGVSSGRRERNRRRTRAAIIDATLSLVHRHGFDAVTIEMIAAAADISPRTFSNYFAGKREAFFAAEPEPVEAIRAAFSHLPRSARLLDALRAVLAELALDIASQAPAMDIRLAVLRAQPRLIPDFRARFGEIEATMAEQIADRLKATSDVTAEADRRPRLLAGMATSLLHGSLEHWRAGDRLEVLPEIVTTSFDVLIKTIADLG